MEEIQRLWRAPLPLRVSVGLGALTIFVTALVGGFGKASAPAVVFFAVFYVLISWLLLRGNKVAWAIVVAGAVLEILSAPFFDSRPWTIPLNLIHLALFLAPSSFQYVWDRPLPFRRI